MKQKATLVLLFLLAIGIGVIDAAPQRARNRTSQARRGAKKKPAAQPPAGQPADETAEEEDKPKTEEELKADLDALLNRPVAERVPRLRFFLQDYPQTTLRGRATKHLISALAALGDEKLQAGDGAAGVEHFKEALSLVPAEMTDKFFVEVVSQFPANLFLRGQGEAAREAARIIESKVKDNAERLLLIGTFYLSVEEADDALRVADAASALAPALVAAHLARGAALRMALRLEDAAAAYARALEIDPAAAAARRGLADLRRANGKPDEALALYREGLAADPSDAAARAGVILSLFDAGKKAEAEQELNATLKENPSQLQLLTGAAYWYMAHGVDAARALDLAGQAVRLEPRYTWAQIVLARALIANQRPLDAERALRLARQYGRFPTLDYELANALAAAGLYEEAAEELSRTFTLKGDQLETQLAGRVLSSAENFTELLAPERRASIFQNAAADTADRARMLKGLLALHLALKEKEAAAKESETDAATAAATAATQFAAGEDDLNALRKLYAASRLLRQDVALETARELVEGSKRGVETALDTSVATNAIMADELRDARARAIALGATPDIPDVPRYVLSNILRGRIEEIIGRAHFNQNRMPEAVTALRRAASVMPPNSLYWRNAHWYLGAALKANNQNEAALAAYLKSYDPRRPDPARRAIIEALYKEINGTLEGFDAKLNQKPAKNIAGLSALTGSGGTQIKTETPASLPANDAIVSPSDVVAPTNSATPDVAPAVTNASDASAAPAAPVTPTPELRLPPDATLLPPPSPEITPTPAAAATDTTRPPLDPAPTPEADKAEPSALTQSQTAEASTAEPTPMPSPATLPAEATTTPVPATEIPVESNPSPATPDQVATRTTRRRRATAAASGDSCTLSLDAESLSVNSGGAATLNARLDNHTGDISATTPDWSHIVILRDPIIDAEASKSAAFKFTIASIGKTPGQFTLIFKSPCGTKELPVTVR